MIKQDLKDLEFTRKLEEKALKEKIDREKFTISKSHFNNKVIGLCIHGGDGHLGKSLSREWGNKLRDYFEDRQRKFSVKLKNCILVPTFNFGLVYVKDMHKKMLKYAAKKYPEQHGSYSKSVCEALKHPCKWLYSSYFVIGPKAFLVSGMYFILSFIDIL